MKIKMNIFFQASVLFAVLSFLHKANAQKCDKVYISQNKACDIHLDVDNLPPCSGKIQDRESCEQVAKCCWNDRTFECYRKPLLCYVDLRPEKCLRRQTLGYNGIYSGFSTNGSYCHVSTLASNSDEARYLGYIPDVGFPITNECRDIWTYRVKRSFQNNCTVHIINAENSNHANQTIRGGKIRNGICVIENKGLIYPFKYIPNDITRQCLCNVDAWLQSENEELSVSSQIKDYVEQNENNSSCTQVLGNMLKRSWFEKVAPINRMEVDVVLSALTQLTNNKVIDGVTLSDAKVLLHSTRKVANYQFYEGIQTDSAENLIERTVSGVNNLMTRAPYLENINFNPDAPDQLITTESVATTQVIQGKEDTGDIKLDLFDTLESVLGTVASHLQFDKDAVELQALESHVDVKIVVAKDENLTQFMNHSELELNHETQHDDEVKIGLLSKQNEEINKKYTKFSAISIFYDYPSNFQSKDQIVEEKPYLASDYLSVSVRGFSEMDSIKISVPVQFSLMRHNDFQVKGYTPQCVFLDKNSTSNDTWSDYGCTTTNSDQNVTQCFCNHTTHFAVLMKFTGQEVSEVHNKVLEIISIVLGSLSIAALSVTLLVFVSYRRTLLKDRMVIHFHLIIAVLGGNISLLLSTLIETKELSTACLVGALASHFFFMASFFWFLVEGIYLFYKVVLVFQKKWVECLPKYAPIFAWCSPLLIVIISYITSRMLAPAHNSEIYYGGYYNPGSCFLNVSNGMIWAFLGPALAIIFINFLILVRVIVIIYRSSSSSTRFANSRNSVRIASSLRRGTRGALILMPILGLPWIVGLLYNTFNDEAAGIIIGTAGAYLHVVLTGIQGILIFLFYCVYNADVRGAYALAAKRRKSMENINSYSNQRKKSTFPLLFSRSNSVASQHNNALQPSPAVVHRNLSMNLYGSNQTVNQYGRSLSMEGIKKQETTAL